MTVTLNSGHGQVVLTEAVAGRRIGKGNQEDLRELNRAIIHEYAANGSTALAVLNVPVGITTATTSYSTLARGKVGLWGNGARVGFSFYGNQTAIRVTLGGVVIGSASVVGSSNAWSTLTPVVLAGATIDADGLATLLVEIQDTTATPTGTPTFYYFVLFEDKLTTAELPGVGNTDTDFLAMHDAAYDSADYPVDTFALQMLDDNVEWLHRDRSRRICHLYPIQGSEPQLCRLSSCQWRLDGPYVIQVPPHADEGLTVNITLQMSATPASLDFEFFALTEFEEFEDVRLSRMQTLTTTALTYATFKGLRAKAGQPCMVWIAYRSEVGSEVTTIDAFTWRSQTPQTIYCERNATLEAVVATHPSGIPWGYCIVGEAEDVAASTDLTIKNALGYSTASQTVDLACVQGIDNSGAAAADRALLLTISPNPSTGVVRAPQFDAVEKWWTGTAGDAVYTPSLSVRRCAITFLYGVYIQCGPTTAPSRKRWVRAGTPPSAALLGAVTNRVNQMVFNGNSATMIRHSMNANHLPSSTLGGGQSVYYAGAYLFTESAGTGGNSYQVTVPLAESNPSGGRGNLTLWGQFIFVATMGDGAAWGEEDIGNYRCRFTSGDWVLGTIPLVKRVTSGAQQSPTVADALVAMTSTSTEIGSSPVVTTGNSYGQCNTWPGDHHNNRAVWVYGVPFSDVSQPSFPTTLIAEIQGLGGNRQPGRVSTQIIVAGLHCWWGPREE